VFDFSVGRAGEDSREGLGEFEAEVVRLGGRRLVVGMEETGGSRRGLAEVVDVVDVEAVADGWWPAPIDPADSRVALGAAAEGLSSMVEEKSELVLHSEEEEGRRDEGGGKRK
jgi:hypothetical protein